MFIFNYHVHKTPFGAVCEGTPVRFRFGVSGAVEVRQLRLMLRNGKTTIPYAFAVADADAAYCYYELTLTAPKWGLYYYRFEVETPNGIHFVGRDKDGNAIGGDFLPEWQLTVYADNIDTRRANGDDIVYHIFVDRFCRAEIPRDARLDQLPPRIYKDWSDDVDIVGPNNTPYNANDFFGGNLQGIIGKLDYLQSLGVTVLFLSPIFLSVSNHRYDTGDYTQIDPLLGTEEDFAQLVQEAARRGMRIMLDGVFNHTGSDSVYFNKDGHFPSFGAYQGTASPYREWFTIHRDGTYDCWWGIQNVPTINKQSRRARRYLFGADGPVAHWTQYGIDWRLDVVDELPDSYLNEVCRCVRAASTTSRLIGEVWEDATTKVAYDKQRYYFESGQLQGVMNYVFREALLAYCRGGNPDDFAQAIMNVAENYPVFCLDHCLTLLGSHDTVRALNEMLGLNISGWSKKRQLDYRLNPQQRRLAMDRLMVAAVLQYTLPGMPTVYYGDEAGMSGFADPINRRPFPWDNPNEHLQRFYQKLGQLRHSLADVLRGAVRFDNTNGILVMLRGEEGKDIAVCANTTDQPRALHLWTNCVDLLSERQLSGDVFLPVNSALILRRA